MTNILSYYYKYIIIHVLSQCWDVLSVDSVDSEDGVAPFSSFDLGAGEAMGILTGDDN